MGVIGGFSNINISPREINLNVLSKDMKYVVIDAYSMICRYTIGSLNSGNHIVDRDGNQIAEIYYLFSMAIRFLSMGIIPIFVFDGIAPKNKNETIEKRKNNKIKADNDLIHITTKDEYIKYLKRTYRINMKNIERAKSLLKLMGVIVVNAPNEADSQCAAIANAYENNIIGIVTDDFDPLMYMSRNILKLKNLGSSKLENYDIRDIIDSIKQQIKQVFETNEQLKEKYNNEIVFTQENLIDIGCLMGTDYCSGLTINNKYSRKGKFSKILEKYLENDMSFDNVLTSCNLSSNFTNKMKQSRDVYTNAIVFDPYEIDIRMNKPNYDLVESICSMFIDDKSISWIIQTLKVIYEKNYGINTIQCNRENVKAYPEPMFMKPITFENCVC